MKGRRALVTLTFPALRPVPAVIIVSYRGVTEHGFDRVTVHTEYLFCLYCYVSRLTMYLPMFFTYLTY